MTLSTAGLGRTQKAIWGDLVGDAWVRHAAIHDEQAGPFGRAAMDAAGPLAGAKVLDVGCGTGAACIELVQRGAREVLGVDLSAPMIGAARAGNKPDGLRFQLGDVLDLDEGGFDVVFSRFGVMFFDDPVSAFGHLRTLGGPGVRLGFCCWGPPSDNGWMAVPVMATAPVLGPPHLAGPGEPGPFSLSSPEVIRDVLGRAGWNAVEVETLTVDQPHPAGDAEAVADVVVEFSPPIAEGIVRSPERAPEVRRAIAEALRPFERDGTVHLRASAHIVTASA